jgi:WD40 repeat protein
MMAKYGYVFQFLCDEILQASYIFLLQVWIISQRRIRNIFKHGTPVYDLNFSPNGHWIATCSPWDKTVRIWRLRDGFSRVLNPSSSSLVRSIQYGWTTLGIWMYSGQVLYMECADRKFGGEVARIFQTCPKSGVHT